MSSEIYDHAVELRQKGFNPLPCLRYVKGPFGGDDKGRSYPERKWKDNGDVVELTDEEFEKWFTHKDLTGLGLVGGKKTGLTLIDWDNYSDGFKEIDLSSAVEIETTSGGKRYIFKYSPGDENLGNYSNIEVKVNTFSVLPPSKCYTKQDDTKIGEYTYTKNDWDKITPVPQKFKDWFMNEKNNKPAKKDTEWKNSLDFDQMAQDNGWHIVYGLEEGQGVDWRGKSYAGRDDLWTSLATVIHLRHKDQDEAEQILRFLNDKMAKPFTERELSKFIHDKKNYAEKIREDSPTDSSENKKEVGDFLVGEPVLLGNLTATPLDEKWLWENYIAKGNITLLTAIMKAGKSTFLRCLFDAMSREEEFAGQPTHRGKILVISEESDDRWVESKDDLQHEETEQNVYVWIRPIRGKPNYKKWEEIVKKIAQICIDKEIDMIVIDTLSSFWPIDNENDNAQVNKALIPLHNFTENEIAVLLIHHDRKGGGDHGESSRGASSLTGFVDNIIHFRRDPNGLPNHRVLKVLGRFPDVPDIVVEYTNDGKYIAKGEPWIVSKAARLEKFVDILKAAGRALSAEELKNIWVSQVGEINVRTIRRYLTELKNSGQVVVDREDTVRRKKVPYYAHTGWEEASYNRPTDSPTPPLAPVLSAVKGDQLSVGLSAVNENRAQPTDRTGASPYRESFVRSYSPQKRDNDIGQEKRKVIWEDD